MKNRRAAVIVAIAALTGIGVWAPPVSRHERSIAAIVRSRVKTLSFFGPAAWSSFEFHLRTGR